MPARISVDRDALTAFCRRNHVRRLSFFGSVVRDDFRADSDIDVLVEFEQAFDPDENLRLALVHLLQTVAEAARHVSRGFQAAHREIPWTAIVGMRHKVVHDYMDVDEEIVWKTAVDESPQLIPLIQQLVTN